MFWFEWRTLSKHDYACQIHSGSLIKSWGHSMRPHKFLRLSAHETGWLWFSILPGFPVYAVGGWIKRILWMIKSSIMQMSPFMLTCKGLSRLLFRSHSPATSSSSSWAFLRCSWFLISNPSSCQKVSFYLVVYKRRQSSHTSTAAKELWSYSELLAYCISQLPPQMKEVPNSTRQSSATPTSLQIPHQFVC